jgi:tetratricopeptide (TPR) repeat protein
MKNFSIFIHLFLIASVLCFFPASGMAESQDFSGPGEKSKTLENQHVASMEAKQHLEGGRRLERERNLPGAIALYSKAASIAPNLAEAHFALGEALAKADRFQEALVRYTLTVTIAPGHREALYARSQLCLRMNLYAQACKDLSQLIDLMPGVADYHYQRATTLLKMKSITEAYRDFLRAHELDKKYPRPSLIWKQESAATKIV